jgi:hypothetical protein
MNTIPLTAIWIIAQELELIFAGIFPIQKKRIVSCEYVNVTKPLCGRAA